jgi:signal peptidase II
MASTTPAAPGLGPWIALSSLVLIFDQLTKAWIVDRLLVAERVTVITDYFDLTLVYNSGAAFSFLAAAGGWQRWALSGVAFAAIAFLVWLLAKHSGQKLFGLAVALLLGGAAGNLLDRVLRGRVVDFFLAHWQETWHFPAFNIADVAITLGAALLILDELQRVKKS